MITPSFALTATERVLPKLALDFTTASLDNRVTFTRTTDATHPATYVNSSGVITASTNNQPRFDYDPVTLACKGLLIEESRTNQIYRSEYFSSSTPAYWGRVGVTAPYGTTTAPDGTSNASSIVGDGAASNGYVYNTVQYNTSASQVFTVSGFFKYNTRRYIQLEGGTSVNGFGVTVDLQNGVITATGSQGTGVYQSSSITSFGNGWYRVVVTGHCGATTNVGYWDMFLTDSSTYVSGVPAITPSSASFYLWGAQLELGAFATSYIGPTTGAALTRNADVATMTGTNFSSWFNAVEGTLVGQYLTPSSVVTGTNRIFAVSNGTSASRIIAFIASSTSIRSLATGGIDKTITVSSAFGAVNKTALAYKNSNYYASSNASATQSSGGTVPSVDQMFLGSYEAGGGLYALNGWLMNFTYYPQRLTSNETQAVSK